MWMLSEKGGKYFLYGQAKLKGQTQHVLSSCGRAGSMVNKEKEGNDERCHHYQSFGGE
jgi:hypothetical protein